MKFNLKLFVLVGVLAGFRDVCGMEEENKDDGDFIVDGLVDNEEEANALKVAMDGKRVIKAVYKTGNDWNYDNVEIISSGFKDNLSYILVCHGKNVVKVETEALAVSGGHICYNMQKDVEYTVYFIFNDVLKSTISMFSWCDALIQADFRFFDTTNVTNMSFMFNRCIALTELDLSNFNTSNVTDMSYMFSECTYLTELDLSKFNTESVTNMYGMFKGCTSLNPVFLPVKGIEIKKKCICCGDEYVCWNNREVEGVDRGSVKFK